MSELIDPARARSELGETVAGVFLDLCEAVPAEEAARLTGVVLRYMGEVRRALAEPALIDDSQAGQIAATCTALLEQYGKLDEAGQAAVVGAVRYFVRRVDGDDDMESPLGFDDDAVVVNFVIDLTGTDVPKVPPL